MNIFKSVRGLVNRRFGKFRETLPVNVHGHLKIREADSVEGLSSGRVILDKDNAIHPENFSILIGRAISDRNFGTIYTMYFGSGGATVDPLGNVSYATPNTVGVADLNIPVFFEVVDDEAGAPPGNQMSVRHITGTLFTDVEVRCVLNKNQPFGQPISDNASSLNVNTSHYVFNEIGLKTQDGLLVTHVTFSPLEKSANRVWEIAYTLRVTVT